MDVMNVIVFARKYEGYLSANVICEIVECLGTEYMDGRWFVQKGARTLQITQLYIWHVLEADYYNYRYGRSAALRVCGNCGENDYTE